MAPPSWWRGGFLAYAGFGPSIFLKGASLRCAPAFGRAEEIFLTRLPRAYALGYRYSAPTGLFLRYRQHFSHTQDYLETRATGLIASLDGFAGGSGAQVGANGGLAVALLCVFVVDEQDFDLTQQIFRPHRLNQQRLCTLPLPLAAESRKCRKNGGGGIVGLLAGGANHLVAGMLGLHLHVGDDHVILGRLQLALGFGGGGGGLHFKPVDFENSFQREQDREFIIDQQDAAFHGALQGTRIRLVQWDASSSHSGCEWDCTLGRF